MIYFILEKNPEYKKKQISHLSTPKYNKLKIGLSSSGWVFQLNTYPSKNIKTLEDWINIFNNPKTIIIDENNNRHTNEEMIKIITERKQFQCGINKEKPLKRSVDYSYITQGEGDYELVDMEELLKRI